MRGKSQNVYSACVAVFEDMYHSDAYLLLCRQPLLLDLHPDPPLCLHGGHTSHRLLLANDQGWWGNQSRPVKFRTLLKSIFSSRTPGCPGQFKTLLPKHPPFPLSHLRYQTCISPLEEQWEGWGWNPENWLLIKIRTTAITKLTYFYPERVLKVNDSISGKVNIPLPSHSVSLDIL